MPKKIQNSIVVLSIEDEASVSELIRTALSMAGFTVLLAATAADGVEKAKRHRPHVILLDLILPDVDGYSVFELLKECGLGDIPVIIVSGCATPDALALGEALGAHDYVTKPFGVHDLIQRVRAASVKAMAQAPEKVASPVSRKRSAHAR